MKTKTVIEKYLNVKNNRGFHYGVKIYSKTHTFLGVVKTILDAKDESKLSVLTMDGSTYPISEIICENELN